MQTTHTRVDEPIHQLMDTRIDAIRAKDVHLAMSRFSRDVRSYDLVSMKALDKSAIEKRLREWFASFEGPIDVEYRELRIGHGADMAFCHFLQHVRGTSTAGKRVEMTFRVTMCARKIAGKWCITHEHSSSPFDMQSGHVVFGVTEPRSRN